MSSLQGLLGKHAEWVLPYLEAMEFDDVVLFASAAGDEAGFLVDVVAPFQEGIQINGILYKSNKPSVLTRAVLVKAWAEAKVSRNLRFQEAFSSLQNIAQVSPSANKPVENSDHRLNPAAFDQAGMRARVCSHSGPLRSSRQDCGNLVSEGLATELVQHVQTKASNVRRPPGTFFGFGCSPVPARNCRKLCGVERNNTLNSLERWTSTPAKVDMSQLASL